MDEALRGDGRFVNFAYAGAQNLELNLFTYDHNGVEVDSWFGVMGCARRGPGCVYGEQFDEHRLRSCIWGALGAVRRRVRTGQ